MPDAPMAIPTLPILGEYKPSQWVIDAQKQLDALKANVVDDFNRIARINGLINRYLFLRMKKGIKGGIGIH